jgi:hypothetical protein
MFSHLQMPEATGFPGFREQTALQHAHDARFAAAPVTKYADGDRQHRLIHDDRADQIGVNLKADQVICCVVVWPHCSFRQSS